MQASYSRELVNGIPLLAMQEHKTEPSNNVGLLQPRSAPSWTKCVQAGSDIIALRGTGATGPCGFGLAPPPTADLGRILAVLVDILLVVDQRVADRLFGVGRSRPQLRNAV